MASPIDIGRTGARLGINRPIVSVYSGFFSGGARNVHTDLVSLMSDQGFPQAVISIKNQVDRGSEGLQKMEDDRNHKRLSSENVPIHTLGLGPKDNTMSPETIKHMAEQLTKLRPGVILSLKEQPVELLVAANRYLESYGLPTYPIIVTLHRTDPETQDSETLQKLRKIERFPSRKKYILGYLACAESATYAYKKALGLKNERPDRFDFIPNGIDLDTFQKAPPQAINDFIKDRLPNVNPDTPIVTIGARNSPEKNIDLFVKAAVTFLSRSPNAHVTMCGTGMTSDKLAPIIAEQTRKLSGIFSRYSSEIDSRIHTLGPIPRPEMPTLATISNIFALTSPTFGEADPLVLKEGMACDAIPVSTCTGDTPSTVGLESHQDYYLTEIEEPFIVGSRGLITSQNPQDIADAWAFAIENQDRFLPNIERYKSEMDDRKFLHRYVQAIMQQLARGTTPEPWPDNTRTVRAFG